jgi:outer membrane lipopolysaccharide assembly protein LptE/RlpB
LPRRNSIQARPKASHGTFDFRRAGSLASFLCVALASVATISGCGYHVAGHGSTLPPQWTTIAVPTFKNDTVQYRIEQRFTVAVIREFIIRTKYHIVPEPEAADAVLHGEILSIDTSPVLFNATTGQVTTMLVTVHAKVTLIAAQAEKPVYENNDMVFRSEYQIPSNVNSFFQQEDPALERMARDFASNLVANVVEGF